MARFFVPQAAIKGKNVIITGPDVKHITRVLRLEPGDFISVITDGREYTAVIKEAEAREVRCEITGEETVNSESPLEIHLYQGLPKGEKMELIIQKSTELGVFQIVPVICDRSIVKLDRKKAQEKQQRWQRVAEEAAKQSRRTGVPIVTEPVDFREAVGLVNDGPGIVPWEQEAAQGIKRVLLPLRGKTKKIAIFIGPEGGLTSGEIELAKAQGIIPVSLGSRILRTETAGIAAAAIVQYELGDLGGV